MTNNSLGLTRPTLVIDRLLATYLAVVAATLAALVVLTVSAPRLAGADAWIHAAIVAGVAVLLPLRWRSARSGSRSALRAVGIVAAVLLLVNVVEALVPGLFPGWMRIEMIGIAVLMSAIVTSVAVLAARDH